MDSQQQHHDDVSGNVIVDGGSSMTVGGGTLINEDSNIVNDLYDSNNHHVIIADNGIIFNSGNNTSTNVTVQLGSTAFLHCHVRHSDRTITGSEVCYLHFMNLAYLNYYNNMSVFMMETIYIS